jgi:hypothetical protein
MIQTTLYVIPGQLFFKTNTILMLIAVLYIYIQIEDRDHLIKNLASLY